MFALVSAYKRALIGVPGNSLEEIRGQLSEPGFDPSKDACLCIGETEHIRETPMTAFGVLVTVPILSQFVASRGVHGG